MAIIIEMRGAVVRALVEITRYGLDVLRAMRRGYLIAVSASAKVKPPLSFCPQ
ncbi:hypothetical protein [Bradyrhizobium centrosematis]|uniref:hypothetical protein n=1 Tax=Bradyrhizobium centrosematis TaxID=1300039 RepID=UPI00388FF561